MQQNEEALLIKKAQNGDVAAYEELIGQYEKTIYQLCLRMLKEPQEAYDAAQEVCIKIWKQLDTFKEESKLSTWIYRIATNQCLDLIRRNKRRAVEISLYQSDDETHQEEKIADKQSVWTDMSEMMTQKEMTEVLMQGISEMKEDYRVILILRDIEEKAYEEIAEILALSIGTVKSRISRARQALKKILEQDKEPYRSFFRHIKE